MIEAAYRSYGLLPQDDESIAHQHASGHANPLDGPLSAPLVRFQELAFDCEQLAALRRSVARWAHGEALGAQRAEELVLAVNELATNSVRYGGGGGHLRMWREADTLMCEVHDAGHIDEPLAGRRLPRPQEPSGRGLWIVNQLCDLVQIRSSPAGSTIRVHMRLS